MVKTEILKFFAWLFLQTIFLVTLWKSMKSVPPGSYCAWMVARTSQWMRHENLILCSIHPSLCKQKDDFKCTLFYMSKWPLPTICGACVLSFCWQWEYIYNDSATNPAKASLMTNKLARVRLLVTKFTEKVTAFLGFRPFSPAQYYNQLELFYI